MAARVTALSNGFRVATDSIPFMKSVVTGICVENGSQNEVDERERGAAHFLEHMLFEGTRTRSADRIKSDIYDLGGDFGAMTTEEMTFYWATSLSESVPSVVEILADMARSSLLRDEGIEKERKIILKEIAYRDDDPGIVIHDRFSEKALGVDPIIGTAEQIAGLERDAVFGHWKRNYTPERMILCSVGDVDHDALVRQAESLFADMERGPAPMARETRFRGGERRIQHEADQFHIAAGHEGVAPDSPEFWTQDVFARILGGSMSSRLFREARERLGLCYKIGAHEEFVGGRSVVYAASCTTRDRIGDLSESILREFIRMAEGVEDAEIARAHACMEHAVASTMQDNDARFADICYSLHWHGRVLGREERMDGIAAATASRVGEFAARLAEGPPALVVRGPFDS